MSNESKTESPSWIGRIWAQDVCKKGVATAISSILIATVLTLWDSKD